MEQQGENPNLGYPVASSTAMRRRATAAGSVGNDCSTSTNDDGNVRADAHVHTEDATSRSTLPSTPLSARHSTATTAAAATAATNSKNSWRWSQNHKTAFADYHRNVVLGRSLQACVYAHIVEPLLPNNWKNLLSLLEEEEEEKMKSGSGKECNATTKLDALMSSTLDTCHFLSRLEEECPGIILDATTSTDDELPLQSWKLCLMQCVIFSSPGIVSQLTEYSVKSRECAMDVYNLLHDENLLKDILYNGGGGPKKQMYGPMMDIYRKILNVSHRAKRGVACNDIFHRLALATALEHAVPICVFDTQIVIDPVERYRHFEDAYMNRELDPYFSTLNIFELRMVVNCDASDQEIAWCREMLGNYRPDHIMNRNDQWKYCMIVKSDIRYKQPEWAPNVPRTYQQLISGGGKCGPRAWFGRFVCKSFGVPTWGVRQPGHAAMSRWSPSGWYICLGGPNWKKSYWENQAGEDFEVDVKARECVELYNVVFWLECFAAVSLDRRQKQFWMNLSKLKKRDIAASVAVMQPRIPEPLDGITRQDSILLLNNKINMDDLDSVKDAGDEEIVLTAGSSITNTSNKVIFMNSVHKSDKKETKQLVHLIQDGSISFEIDTTCDAIYNLVAHVVTVHSNPCPLQLQIVNGGTRVNHEINIPYTKGYRDTTEEIQIKLHAGLNNIRFYRQHGLGLTIEKFVFTPTDKAL